MVTDPSDLLLSISSEEGHEHYNISYIPTTTGPHQVHITVGSGEQKMHIAGSPFTVLVQPGRTNAETSEAVGAGVAGLVRQGQQKVPDHPKGEHCCRKFHVQADRREEVT